MSDTALNKRSRNMTAGVERTPNRSMLRAVGFDDADFDRPIVGIASAGSEVTPCNMHLDDLAEVAKEGVRASGGVPLRYNTFVVTDGEAMGHEGMKASLVRRSSPTPSSWFRSGTSSTRSSAWAAATRRFPALSCQWRG